MTVQNGLQILASLISCKAFSYHSDKYGGSIKIISNFVSDFCCFKYADASFFITVYFSVGICKLFKLDLIIWYAFGFFSIKTALCAPLLRASIPKAPEPAKRSNTTAFSIFSLIILKRLSLTLSEVGRVMSWPGRVERRRRLYFPAITKEPC